MANDLSLEVEKAQLESHHLIESVAVDGTRGNPKLVVTPTDSHARWQLQDEQWRDYEAYIEMETPVRRVVAEYMEDHKHE